MSNPATAPAERTHHVSGDGRRHDGRRHHDQRREHAHDHDDGADRRDHEDHQSHPAWLHPLRALVRNYEWVHTLLGLVGNLAFVVGSVFFLFESLKTAGVWLFVFGSIGMFIGSAGRAVLTYEFGSGDD